MDPDKCPRPGEKKDPVTADPLRGMPAEQVADKIRAGKTPPEQRKKRRRRRGRRRGEPGDGSRDAQGETTGPAPGRVESGDTPEAEPTASGEPEERPEKGPAAGGSAPSGRRRRRRRRRRKDGDGSSGGSAGGGGA